MLVGAEFPLEWMQLSNVFSNPLIFLDRHARLRVYAVSERSWTFDVDEIGQEVVFGEVAVAFRALTLRETTVSNKD